MKEIEADVVIVGSGLIGLVAAHSLSRLNYNVVLVDKKKFSKSSSVLKDTRTVAISEGSKQFLDFLSLWSDLKEFAEPISQIKVFDRNSKNKILFSNNKNNQKLGYVIENSIFSKILREKINKVGSINQIYGSPVKKIILDNKYNKTYLEDKFIKSRLIIAADGKNSHVRKLAGNLTYKKNYSEKALVLNFFHEKNLSNTAYEIFYKTGPLAILPMIKGNNYFQSSIIWSHKSSFIKKLIECDNNFIAGYLEERVGDYLGKIYKINSKQSFPLSAHINDSFINKRLIYVGDSAHSIHPIAGQGWNLGVKDIKNLYSICKQIKSKSDFGNNIFCKKFNNLNYKNAFQLYQITDKLNLHFKNNSSFYRAFSNTGLKLIERNNFLKEKITKYAMGT